MNLVEKFILNIIKHKIAAWFELERSLAKMSGVFKSAEDSPEKSWPNPDKIPGGEEVPFSIQNIPVVGPSLSSCVHQGTKAIKGIKKNPEKNRTDISTSELNEFEIFAKEKGICAIGYAKLPQNLIFKDRAVLYDTAIVFTMRQMYKVIPSQCNSAAAG